jgi:hypothetical protein
VSQAPIIRFKQAPDRRFRVLPAKERLCGDADGYTRCAFFLSVCTEHYNGAAFDICQRGFFFEVVEE